MTLYRQGKVPGCFYDGFGQEAVSRRRRVGDGAPQDRLCILHRDLAAHVIRGVEPRAHLRPVHGPRRTASPRGRDGNVHFGDRTQGLRRDGLDAPRHDARSRPAWRWRSSCAASSACAITWFGDGSTSRGDFHEAMNWAGVQKLPVIFVLENNQYAYSTPLDQQFAVDPVERAAAYGFPGVTRRRQRPRGDVRGDPPGARARARRRGPDADRGRDHAHARPRRARRHEVRAARRRSRSGARKDPIDRQTRRARGARRRRRRRSATRSRRTIDAAVEEALAIADARPGDTATDGLFADEPALLEDGDGALVAASRRRSADADA